MKMIPKKHVEQETPETDETDDLVNLSHADKETVDREKHVEQETDETDDLVNLSHADKETVDRVLKGADGVAKTSIPLDAQPVTYNEILQTLIEHLISKRGTPKLLINETETDFVLTLTWGKK